MTKFDKLFKTIMEDSEYLGSEEQKDMTALEVQDDIQTEIIKVKLIKEVYNNEIFYYCVAADNEDYNINDGDANSRAKTPGEAFQKYCDENQILTEGILSDFTLSREYKKYSDLILSKLKNNIDCLNGSDDECSSAFRKLKEAASEKLTPGKFSQDFRNKIQLFINDIINARNLVKSPNPTGQVTGAPDKRIITV